MCDWGGILILLLSVQFGEMKKKKKKGKKGGFDLEAFEKELGEGTDKVQETAIESKDGDDDADLGEDPFARGGDAGVEESSGGNVEAWQGTDRDYTYQEVSVIIIECKYQAHWISLLSVSYSVGSSILCELKILHCLGTRRNIRLSHLQLHEMAPRRQCSPMLWKFARECEGSQTMSFNSYSPNWEQ